MSLDALQHLQTNHFLSELFAEVECGALVLTDGQVLHVKYETLADIGTLSTACLNTHKYLNLKPGEIVMLNDPYSGGSVLTSITLISPFHPGENSQSEIILGLRIWFRHHLVLAKTIDDEGVRIPPTPIAKNGIVNNDILNAIAAHPLAPEDFKPRIQNTISEMQGMIESLKVLSKRQPAFFSKQNLKDYFNHCYDSVKNLLHDFPSTENKFEMVSDSGETLAMKIELSEDKVNIDFRGSSPSKMLALTDSATFGACFGGVSAFLNQPIPVNSGSFSVLQVSSPVGCFLNARFPSPTFLGMTHGTSWVASSVLWGLGQMSKGKEMGMSCLGSMMVQLEFADGNRFFDFVPGGIGGSWLGPGESGLPLWHKHRLQPSIELIEQKFPMLIHRVAACRSHTGKAKHMGGSGLTKEYEIQSHAKLTWFMDQTRTRPAGALQGNLGSTAEMFVLSKGKKSQLVAFGQIDLHPGDRLFVVSPSAGGWGKHES